MSRPEPSELDIEKGRRTEDDAYELLKRYQREGKLDWFSKPDWVYWKAGNLYQVEIKQQEMFTAPPFDGHGLPEYQAQRYELVRERYGIRTLLIVWDETTCWWQWIDELLAGRKHTTPRSRRIIFPLESFTQKDEWSRGAA